jgi:hypothetical protein
MNFKIEGGALELLRDFIRYAKKYQEEMADVMHYDPVGLNRSRNLLEKAVNGMIEREDLI